MNPEELHLATWFKTHKTPELLSFVDPEVRKILSASSDEDVSITPFDFIRFVNEGGFQESFEKIGSFYVLHAYPTDGRRKARLKQIWSASSWMLLEELVQTFSPAKDLDVIRAMADELQTSQVKESVCVIGLFAFSCAAGRRYWRQTERVAERLDPTMRRILRGFVVRNQVSDREKIAPHFRHTLARVLGHGAD